VAKAVAPTGPYPALYVCEQLGCHQGLE